MWISTGASWVLGISFVLRVCAPCTSAVCPLKEVHRCMIQYAYQLGRLSQLMRKPINTACTTQRIRTSVTDRSWMSAVPPGALAMPSAADTRLLYALLNAVKHLTYVHSSSCSLQQMALLPPFPPELDSLAPSAVQTLHGHSQHGPQIERH